MSAMTSLLDSVAPAEQQAVEVGAASTEQRTAEVLAALNRLRSDEVIALDDVLYVADGCVTYVSFGPVASVPPPVLALTVNRPYALAVEVERPTRHSEGRLLSCRIPSGGFVLSVRDSRLVHEYTCGGAMYTVRSDREVPTGSSTLRYVFTPTGHLQGSGALYINDRRVGARAIPHTWPCVTASEDHGSGQARGTSPRTRAQEELSFTGTIKTVMFVGVLRGADAPTGTSPG